MVSAESCSAEPRERIVADAQAQPISGVGKSAGANSTVASLLLVASVTLFDSCPDAESATSAPVLSYAIFSIV